MNYIKQHLAKKCIDDLWTEMVLRRKCIYGFAIIHGVGNDVGYNNTRIVGMTVEEIDAQDMEIIDGILDGTLKNFAEGHDIEYKKAELRIRYIDNAFWIVYNNLS